MAAILLVIFLLAALVWYTALDGSPKTHSKYQYATPNQLDNYRAIQAPASSDPPLSNVGMIEASVEECPMTGRYDEWGRPLNYDEWSRQLDMEMAEFWILMSRIDRDATESDTMWCHAFAVGRKVYRELRDETVTWTKCE